MAPYTDPVLFDALHCTADPDRAVADLIARRITTATAPIERALAAEQGAVRALTAQLDRLTDRLIAAGSPPPEPEAVVTMVNADDETVAVPFHPYAAAHEWLITHGLDGLDEIAVLRVERADRVSW